MSAKLETDRDRLLFRAQSMARALAGYARDKIQDPNDPRVHDIENVCEEIAELIERALDALAQTGVSAAARKAAAANLASEGRLEK